jgi:hypothetical protein
MLEKIQNHPIVWLVITLIGLAASLKTLWPFFKDKKFPDILAGWEMPLDMLFSYESIAVVVGICVVSLQLAVIQAFRAARVKPILLTPDNLIIHYAGYGSEPGKYHNVTEKVASLIQNGRIRAYASNDAFGDTDPGALKEVFIVYSYGENEGKYKTIPEQKLIILPETDHS